METADHQAQTTLRRSGRERSWKIETPIGDLATHHAPARGGWVIVTNLKPGTSASRYDFERSTGSLSLELWLRLTGLGEVVTPTRREMLSVVEATLERYPLTPAQAFCEMYGFDPPDLSAKRY